MARALATVGAEGVPAEMTIMVEVNGDARELRVAPWVTLLDVLREYLDLPGTKNGCDQEQCRECTVLVDGVPVLSCLSLAVMEDGADVTTIEDLGDAGAIQSRQAAFVEHAAS